MSNSILFGHLEGFVVEIDKSDPGINFKVRVSSGKICLATDLRGVLDHVTVGMKVCLEGAYAFFDNGEIDYIVDENLRGVHVGDECVTFPLTTQPQIPEGFDRDLSIINGGG